jgi:hypothetical protein
MMDFDHSTVYLSLFNLKFFCPGTYQSAGFFIQQVNHFPGWIIFDCRNGIIEDKTDQHFAENKC